MIVVLRHGIRHDFLEIHLLLEMIISTLLLLSDLSTNKHLGTLFLHGNFHVHVFGEFVYLFFGGICCEEKWNFEPITKYIDWMGFCLGDR